MDGEREKKYDGFDKSTFFLINFERQSKPPSSFFLFQDFDSRRSCCRLPKMRVKLNVDAELTVN